MESPNKIYGTDRAAISRHDYILLEGARDEAREGVRDGWPAI